MKKRIKLKGRIRTYMQFCIYLGVLLCAIDAASFLIDVRAGALLAGYIVIYFGIDQLCHRIRTDSEKAAAGDGSALRAFGR